jgi:hypothetical protein
VRQKGDKNLNFSNHQQKSEQKLEIKEKGRHKDLRLTIK